MKTNFLQLLSCILLSFSFISCDKDDEEVYYVKYEIKYTDHPNYLPSAINVDLITDKGFQCLDISPEWEGVYGPFYSLEKVGFEVRTNNIITMSGEAKVDGRISISSGNQPFVLKSEVIKTFGEIRNDYFSVYYKVEPSDLN